jgi:hypothetical protein
LSHVLPEGASPSQLEAWIVGLEQDRERLAGELSEKIDRSRHAQYSLVEYDETFKDHRPVSDWAFANYRERIAGDLVKCIEQVRALQSVIDEYDAVIKTYRDRLHQFTAPSEERLAQERKELRRTLSAMFCLCETVATPEEIEAAKSGTLTAEYDDRDRIGQCLASNREIVSRAISLLDRICDRKESLTKLLVDQSKGWHNDDSQL